MQSISILDLFIPYTDSVTDLAEFLRYFVVYPFLPILLFGIILSIKYRDSRPMELHASLFIMTLNLISSIAAMYDAIIYRGESLFLSSFIMSSMSLIGTTAFIAYCAYGKLVSRKLTVMSFPLFAFGPLIQIAIFQYIWGYLRLA